MDCSTPSSPVLHHLLEFAQTHVHWPVIPSSHLILCRPFLLLPWIFPSIKVFSNELALRIRWPKDWSFNFSISPSKDYSELISFRIDWFDLPSVQGILKSLSQHHSLKASVLWCSVFFVAQLSRAFGKTTVTSLFPEDTCCPSSPPHLDINNSSIATTVTSRNSTDHGFIINFDCITFKFVSHSKQETSWGENQLLFMFVPTVPSVPASPWGYSVTAEGLGGCTAELRRVGSMIWWINVPLTNSQQPFSYLNRTVSAAPRNCFQCSSRMTHFCTWNLPLGGKLLKALVQLWRGRRQG